MSDTKNKQKSEGLVVVQDPGDSDGVRRRQGWQEQATEQLQNMTQSYCSRAYLEKRLPIINWLPKYTIEDLQADTLAGITVGLTVIPQGIAYAVVAGVEPNYGLYSSFIGCFVYALFGSCKDITIGPTAIMAIMTHEYTQGLPCKDDTVALCNMTVLLTFLTGSIILLANVFRIGFLITFIGRPVISGFTSAAAITIATSQVKGMLGLSFESEGFVNTWEYIFTHLHETRWQDLVLATSCVVALLFMKWMRNIKAVLPQVSDKLGTRVWKKALFISSTGRNAIVVVLSTMIAYFLRELAPFEITGDITPGFPTLSMPEFSLSCNSSDGNSTEYYNFLEIAGFFSSGLAIVPLIAILENIAIASAFSHGKAIDATQEMLALGLCNLIGSFFQSIPTTGSFSRTAVNSSSGVRTQAGGITTGLLVILALLFLTPAFKYIPKPALSAVIVCAVIFMIEYHDILPIWRAYKWDQIPLWVTFLVCLFWALEWGILVGTGINICLLLYMQATPIITVSLLQGAEEGSEAVVVVQPALGLMFPSSELVKKKTADAGVSHMPLLVVLDCSHVTIVDYTSVKAIQNLVDDFSSRKQRVAFACMNSRVKISLQSLIPNLEEVYLPQQSSSSSPSSVPLAAPLILNSSDTSGNSSPTPLIRSDQGSSSEKETNTANEDRNNTDTAAKTVETETKTAATTATPTAAGTVTTATGEVTTSTAVLNTGTGTTATGAVTTATGIVTTGAGLGTTATGTVTTAAGSVTTVAGSGTTATGAVTTAAGSGTTVAGSGTTATGAVTTAAGSGTTVAGSGTTATDPVTTAAGSETIATGPVTTAAGSETIATGGVTKADEKRGEHEITDRSEQQSAAPAVTTVDSNGAEQQQQQEEKQQELLQQDDDTDDADDSASDPLLGAGTEPNKPVVLTKNV